MIYTGQIKVQPDTGGQSRRQGAECRGARSDELRLIDFCLGAKPSRNSANPGNMKQSTCDNGINFSIHGKLVN